MINKKKGQYFKNNIYLNSYRKKVNQKQARGEKFFLS